MKFLETTMGKDLDLFFSLCRQQIHEEPCNCDECVAYSQKYNDEYAELAASIEEKQAEEARREEEANARVDAELEDRYYRNQGL